MIEAVAPDVVAERVIRDRDRSFGARVTERALRSIVRLRCWTEQRRLWEATLR